MPYGVEEVYEVPPPQNAVEFHQRFYDEMAVAELSGDPQLLGTDVAQKRWGMVRSAVKVFKPGTNLGQTKALDGAYELEALDERHRMADMLSTMQAYFYRTFPVTFHTRRTLFYMWLDRFTEAFPNDVKTILKETYKTQFPDSAYEAFVTTGVDYKDNPLRRFTCLITVRGGKMYKHYPGKSPFDTRKTQTHFSGAGWAIYVVSGSGLWYAGSHKVGQLQHSSFTGGRPVTSAGEIQVHDGVPLIISAKSGHYKPTLVQFMNGLNLLKQAGVNMEMMKVAVFEVGTKQKTLLTAAAFLVNAGLRNRYTVW